MAQYGDPQYPDFSRFQRYTPGAESPSQGQPGHGQATPTHGSMGAQPVANPRYQNPIGSPQPGRPTQHGGGAPIRPQGGQEGGNPEAGNPDPDWTQRLSGSARKRNQWRQFQTLKPDFGGPTSAAEPAPVPPPPRNASLPVFQSPQRPSVPPPQGKYPAIPPERTSPTRDDPPQASTPRAMATETVLPLGSIQPPPNLRGAMPRPRAAGSHQGGTQPPLLQAHPHNTALPNPVGTGPSAGPSSYQRKADFASKVTPLRPSVKRTSRPQGSSSGVPQPAAPGPANSRSPEASKNRPGAKPRRRLAKPPVLVLYLIRLVILGVGVAAIAGTLLSVLSPSNLASSPGQEDRTEDIAKGSATGPLVAGTTANLVSDIALGQELTRLKAEIEQLATLTPGLEQSAFLVDLDTGDYINIAGGQAISAASTIKVPILVAFLQAVDAGQIALNQGLVMQEEQIAGGSGTMQNNPVGTRYTALEVATQMIVTSDNTATNMMIDVLGGSDALNQQFQVWGLESTVLRNPLPDLDGTNTTSTQDLALLMALIDQGGLLTSRSRDRMVSIMQRTVNRSLIPFGINDDSILANKTGDIGTILGDVALVDAPNGKRYVISTLVERPDNDGRASELIRRAAEAAHTELSQPIAPVGGIDPSTPEDTVPAPTSDGEEEVPSPEPSPEENLNREEVPQG